MVDHETTGHERQHRALYAGLVGFVVGLVICAVLIVPGGDWFPFGLAVAGALIIGLWLFLDWRLSSPVTDRSGRR